jgi:gliding motility-associated-like protein
MTEKRTFLTQLLKPIFLKKSYFTTNNINLKQRLLFAALLLSFAPLFGQGSIAFIENKGQWDSRVLYKGDVSNGSVFLRKNGITILQHNAVELAEFTKLKHLHGEGLVLNKQAAEKTLHSHSWNVDFIAANPAPVITSSKVLPGYNNYFIGNDPGKWGSDCRSFQVVTLENIYPGVDARYYTDNGTLKYDLVVKPGGDVSKIALKYEGVDNIEVKNKELSITTSVGEMREGKPFTYQAGLSGRNEINCRYVVKDNILRFDIKNYDPAVTLVIDPTIEFCSFSGSTADNWGFTATYGPDGSMFGGGQVYGTGFPVNTGASQTTFGGGSYDIGIIKLSPDGSSKIYATYIGGNGDEQPQSLVAASDGTLVIAGRTNSSVSGAGAYPVMNNGVTAGALYDIVVTKLNATGTALIGSRRIGGTRDDGVNMDASRSLNSLQRNYGDDGRSEVILDAAGNIYVASNTQSDNFPVTAGCFQPTFGGGDRPQDGVVLKFNANLSGLLFSSYLGGSKDDAAYVLSLAPNGDIFVAGGTSSADFPGNKAGTIGTSFTNSGGPLSIDGYIAVINNAGTAITRSTYIGTSGLDQVFGVQFDNNGFPYIMGQTTGNWQVVNNVPGSTSFYSNAGGKQFIAKLQPTLSSYVYSTMFGTGAATPNISPVAFLVDRCENVYISGWGGHYDLANPFNSAGTTGLPVTSDAFKSNTDNRDFYFFVLKKNAASQLFGSFFGENNAAGGGGDHVDGGTSRFDKNGTIYQAICANCKIVTPVPVFPTTPGSAFPVNLATNSPNGRAGCNLAMVKISMNLAGVAAGVQSAIDGTIRDTTGCIPQTVDFSDTIANAQSYEWYFDYVPGNAPNLSTIAPNAQWTFNTAGIHRVMLVAIDPATCNVRDSSYMNIKIGITKAIPEFIATRQQPCTDFRYLFTNTTPEPGTHPFKDTSFVWDFGDGTPTVRANKLPAISHQYAAAGTYNVRLLLNDTTYCNSPDDTVLQLQVAINVVAGISGNQRVCINKATQFTSTSTGAESYLWNFGDGNTSTAQNPFHTYTSAGPFTVTLTAFNTGSCNGQDVATFNITVFDTPTAIASFSPVPPQVNTPTVFTNSSLNAINYKWLFGDGDSLEVNSLQSVTHQYNATGSFNAFLIAFNQAGCSDTLPMVVNTLIEPLADVPNAFTPLSGDENSIVFVRGFGIAKMQFIIWNRWGQKIFETNNQKQGWDGRVKGVVQPMDVYAYTLSIEFFDGKKLTKKGDLTLIR